MSHSVSPSAPARWRPLWALGALLLGLLALGAYYGFDIRWRDYGTGDWISYWSIPRGLLLGRGFYDAQWLRDTQMAVGYDRLDYGAIREYFWPLHNPPPLIVPLMPFGAMDFTLATLAWLGLAVALFSDAALRFNRALPHPMPEPIAVIVALLFLPFLAAMFWGQVTPLMGALLVYAWQAQRRGRETAAGVLLVPLLLKPHLLFLALFLLLWVGLCRRQWRMLGSFGALTLTLVIFAFVLDPTWVQGWVEQSWAARWQSVGFWDMLTTAFGLPEWVQFAGIPFGAAVALWRYRKVREVTPRMLGEATVLSIVCSPLLWHHDLSVMLPAALWIAASLWARGLRLPLLVHTALNLWLMPFAELTIRFLPYIALFFLLWLWTGRSQPAPRDAPLSARVS